jgi:hypothetical protein
VVATVGPSELEYLSIPVSGHNGEFMLMATGLSSSEPGQRYFTWLEDDLAATDIVRERYATFAAAKEQRNKIASATSANSQRARWVP